MSLTAFSLDRLVEKTEWVEAQSPWLIKAHLLFTNDYNIQDSLIGKYIRLDSGVKLNVYLFNALRLLGIDAETIEWIEHDVVLIDVLYDKVPDGFILNASRVDAFKARLIHKAMPALVEGAGMPKPATPRPTNPLRFKEVI